LEITVLKALKVFKDLLMDRKDTRDVRDTRDFRDL
jgi:hypothetical protein